MQRWSATRGQHCNGEFFRIAYSTAKISYVCTVCRCCTAKSSALLDSSCRDSHRNVSLVPRPHPFLKGNRAGVTTFCGSLRLGTPGPHRHGRMGFPGPRSTVRMGTLTPIFTVKWGSWDPYCIGRLGIPL